MHLDPPGPPPLAPACPPARHPFKEETKGVWKFRFMVFDLMKRHGIQQEMDPCASKCIHMKTPQVSAIGPPRKIYKKHFFEYFSGPWANA